MNRNCGYKTNKALAILKELIVATTCRQQVRIVPVLIDVQGKAP